MFIYRGKRQFYFLTKHMRSRNFTNIELVSNSVDYKNRNSTKDEKIQESKSTTIKKRKKKRKESA